MVWEKKNWIYEHLVKTISRTFVYKKFPRFCVKEFEDSSRNKCEKDTIIFLKWTQINNMASKK